MNMNIKRIFLLTTLVFLLVGLGALSAADSPGNVTTTTSHASVTTTTASHADDVVTTDTSVNKKTSLKTSVSKESNDKQLTSEKKTSTKKNTSTKQLKTDNEVNLYVSDSDGSDENAGSQDAPYKTVGKAISATTNDSVYNIHVAAGTYKGVGNTNLTVPGNNTINFIGSGVNKTVFDGEVNYDIQQNGFYWGSSDNWKNYINATGNWFMNITPGNGKITITNMTMENAWVKGGSSFAAYKQAPIDNYATLDVINVYFYNNHCGVGAAIRNRPNATLTVNNSIFDSNRKSDSTGNMGIIYNNGTAYLNNLLFTDNYARWGTVTNDHILYIANSTLMNGKGYDGTSGFKNGPGIYVNTGTADYYRQYKVTDIYTSIENCTFINNNQCDINIGSGDVSIIGNKFINSTGIYELNPRYVSETSHNITNNTFSNMQPSTLTVTMLSASKPVYAFYSASSVFNTTINGNKIDVSNLSTGYGLYLTANSYVYNNTLNNYIYLNGNNNIIANNTVKTLRDYTVTTSSSAKNNTIVNNTLSSGMLSGDLSVSSNNNNIVENNTPKASIIIVTNNNYSQYFDADGKIIPGTIQSGSKILFSGNITNKKFVFNNINVYLANNDTAVLYNSSIISENDSRIAIDGLKINNTDSSIGYVILLNSTNNKVINSEINVNTNGKIHAIILADDENTIQSTKVNVVGPSVDVDWSKYPVGITNTVGILVQSSDNYINITNVTVKANNNRTAYGTVDGIDIQSPTAGLLVSGNTLYNTRINVDGDMYAYALNIARAEETSTSLSYFTANSNNYAYALQISGPSYNNNIAGYATATSTNVSYGAYLTGQWSGTVTNNSLEKFYIQNITAPTSIGVELEGVKNTTIGNATYRLYGDKNTGFIIINTNNTRIYAITSTSTSGNKNNTMMTITRSGNVTVTGNTFNQKVGNGIIVSQSNNVNITKNYLNIGNITGGNAAVTNETSDNVTVESNTPTIILLTDETYTTYFDENATLRDNINFDILTLNGDLHNKDLTFNKAVTFLNSGTYTIYNGTIIFLLNGGDRNLNYININNVNKTAIRTIQDPTNSSYQTSIYIKYSNITVTGDNLSAISSNSSEGTSYAYISLNYDNITMTGSNSTIVNFTGQPNSNPRWSPSGAIELNYDNITLKGNTAKVLDVTTANVYFKYNNVKFDGDNITVINANNGLLSYYDGFQYNNITGTGDDISVIIYTNDSTTNNKNWYYNNIRLNSNNPVLAFNVTNATRIYLNDNTILINATNDETPVISVANGSRNEVTDNYIQALDVAGDDAVEQTGITISNNQPVEGNYTVIINTNIPENTTINKYITIQANATDVFGNPINGTIAIYADGELIISQPFTSNVTAYYVPEEAGRKVITITYTDPNGVYATTNVTNNLQALLNNAIITIDPVNTTINKTTQITVTVTGEDGRAVTNGTVELITEDETYLGTANVTNGVATITVTPTEIINTTIYAHYLGNELYNETTANTTYTVNNIKPAVTVQNMTCTSNTTTVNVKVVDVNGNNIADGTVTILVNGKTYQANVTNGIASITIPSGALKVGNNILSINYNNNTFGYEPASTTYYTNGTKYGPVYYVAVNGSSSNNGRTPETPWNYTYAFNTIRNSTYNNSLIYILDGVYSVNSTVLFNNGLTLKVIGYNNTVLNGNNKKINAFNIQNGVLSIEKLTFKNFANTPILNRANNTTIIGNKFMNNKGINGGAISNWNANNALITGNIFQNNTGMYGGAVYNRANNTIITNNTFTKNNASISSGAIYNIGRNTKITNNIFTNNHANTLGGAINNWETQNTIITDNKFNGNQANYGGAIYYRGTGLKLNNNNMTSNTARVSGGAVFVIGTSNNITHNNFTANKARSGAAINNLGTNTYIRGNTIKYNTANTTGAAVNNWNARNATIINNTIHHNQAQYGAIYIRGANNTVRSNNIYSNKASISGGAIFNIGVNSTIYGNTLRSNNANNYGGAINNWNARNTRITGNNLTYNNATYGGAINTRATDTIIMENIITRNSAVKGGAILDTGYTSTLMNHNNIKNNPTQNGLEVAH
ncbi:MAG: right-handed parallel beta-helix repeat-containing protein [Methanobacteriaceae archaeon]|nr:right-handed parallel beta-helix repeat-containing protein [Methanobacteriaceae archaeon]